MVIKLKFENDGKCFADLGEECKCLIEKHRSCGSYYCPFYKPADYKDWIRRDNESSVIMIPPEEYYDE